MLRIVIPAAGAGKRFVAAGYKDPKPFIDLNGKPMIQRVIDNLTPCEPHRFTLLFQREHEEYVKKHKLDERADIVWVNGLTEGAACTVLLSEPLMRRGDSLLIANSDQLVDFNDGVCINVLSFGTCEEKSIWWRNSNTVQDFINDSRIRHLNGSVAIFKSDGNSKWSYAKTNEYGYITEVAEKRAISDWATVGLYYFERSSYFIEAAKQMIKKNIRTNGEFYVAPTINETEETFGVYGIKKMWPLGTPEDMEKEWPLYRIMHD